MFSFFRIYCILQFRLSILTGIKWSPHSKFQSSNTHAFWHCQAHFPISRSLKMPAIFPLPVHDGSIVTPRHHSGIHHLPHRLLCPLPICSSAQLAPQDRLYVSAASAAVTEWIGEALDRRYWSRWISDTKS